MLLPSNVHVFFALLSFSDSKRSLSCLHDSAFPPFRIPQPASYAIASVSVWKGELPLFVNFFGTSPCVDRKVVVISCNGRRWRWEQANFFRRVGNEIVHFGKVLRRSGGGTLARIGLWKPTLTNGLGPPRQVFGMGVHGSSHIDIIHGPV